MKNIGIIANVKKEMTKGVVNEIIRWAEKENIGFFLAEELVPVVGHSEAALPVMELWQEINALISLGGDGTMLASARAVGVHQVPILGINLGGVGFLTEINSNDLTNTLNRLKKGEYFIEKRMVLESEVEGFQKLQQYALNDIVIDKGEIARLFLLHLYADDEFICSYSADGLIVSTPSGSTAYNLAAGGPIINPRMNAIIVSPICPHTLASRTILFSEKETLKVKVELDSREAGLTIDGQVAFHLKSGSSVIIRKAGHSVNLIKFRDRSFYEILRTKLHWGARPKTGE
jgi:NAD+ kinase